MINCPKRPVPLATPCLVVPWGGRVTNCANLTHFGDGDDEDDELAEILKSPRRNMQLRLYILYFARSRARVKVKLILILRLRGSLYLSTRLFASIGLCRYYPHTSLSVGFDQQQEEYDRTGRLYQSFQGYASAYAMVGGNAPRKKAQALADAKRWYRHDIQTFLNDHD